MSVDSHPGATELYRALFQQSRDAVVLISEDGSVLDANPEALRLFGLDAERFSQQNSADYWVDLGERARMRAAVAESGHVSDFPARLRKANGTVFDAIVSGTAYRLPNGRTVFQSVLRDETERLNREMELGERVKELRCLYGVSRVLAQPPATEHELLERLVTLLPPAFQFPEVAEAQIELDGCSARTVGYEHTPWHLTQDVRVDDKIVGRIAVAYRAPAGFLDEEIELLDEIAQRIAEHRRGQRAEHELAQREAFYRTVLENATDLITLVDARGIIRWASGASLRLTGYETHEMLGKFVPDDMHPDDLPAVLEALEQASGPAGVAPREYRARRKDGVYRWYETTARPLNDQGDVLCVTRDCTERRELREQLHRAQKMDAVGQLAGAIAHDFNNILTVIETNASFVIDALPTGSQALEDAGEIRRAAEHAATLTRRLLAFSKRQVLERRTFEIDQLIGELRNMLRRLIGEHVEIQTLPGAPGACVLADVGQIEQVLLNLFLNARDAMPAGGRLTLRSERVTLDRENPDLPAGNYVRISVSDTGHGIAPHVLPRIFDPFFTTKPKGTGLGLSTVYGIVRQSGGSIHVASELGVGATFEVLLPERAASVAQVESNVARRSPHAPKVVLLVEDDTAVRAPVQRALEAAGHTVLAAACPITALDIARRHPGRIDALISDVVMPTMSGPMMAESFRALRPDTAVLFVSGYPHDELERHGFAHSGARFLAKPFSADRLCRALQDAVAAHAKCSPSEMDAVRAGGLGTP